MQFLHEARDVEVRQGQTDLISGEHRISFIQEEFEHANDLVESVAECLFCSGGRSQCFPKVNDQLMTTWGCLAFRNSLQSPG